jgi:ketosteroid isomerase-like protein
MKTHKIFLVLIVASAIPNLVYAQQANTVDSLQLLIQFQQQVEVWKEAYNSKNAQNLAPLYTSDARYISSHVAGLVADGRDKLIANFQNGMNMGGYIDSIEIITMTVSCDIASLLCKYQATNNGVTAIGRNVLIMKKTNNEWLIMLHMTVV